MIPGKESTIQFHGFTFHRNAIVVALLLCLAGCVANKPYRTQVIPLPETLERTTAPATLPDTTYKDQKPGIVLRSGDVKYDLAYIEFDDMGEYWTIGDLTGRHNVENDSQVERTVRLIQLRQKEQEPLAVITFIHGWKNNASPHDEKDGNLKDFKETMRKLACSDPSRHYIAVFIAWRGQVIPNNYFSSYWNRRSAAMRVGGISMTEALFRLMFVTKPPISPTIANRCGNHLTESDYPTVRRDPVTGKGLAESAIAGVDTQGAAVSPESQPRSFLKDRFVVVGHSFGARVLERALSQPLMALLYERQSEAVACVQRFNALNPKDQLSNSPLFQSPADLIAMINSANDSFETKAMIEGMARMNLSSCMGTDCRRSKDPAYQTPSNGSATNPLPSNASAAHPLIVAILSAGDQATTIAMPLAQRISYFDQNLDRKYDKATKAHEEGQIDVPKQHTFFFHNEASIPQLISHTVEPESVPQCDTYPHFSNGQTCFVLRAKQALPNQFVNTTPFWVFGVPSSVIPNHTGIFQPGTVALLQMIISNAMESSTPLNLTLKQTVKDSN